MTIKDDDRPIVPHFSRNIVEENRDIRAAEVGDPTLGPLKLLPGTWSNLRDPDKENDPSANPLTGRGWNLIALPFVRAVGGPPYRVLMNQYNETLQFDFIDDNVPNRGIDLSLDTPANTDQKVAALDYTQQIHQIRAADDAGTTLAGDDGIAIHHEPGFFLHMKEQTIRDFDIARLATIPHGNSATAVGKSVEFDGPPTIPPLSGLPEGASNFDPLDAMNRPGTPEAGYLAPYKHFIDNPFLGVQSPPFPGFNPVDTNALINAGLAQIADKVTKTTELVLDTDLMEAGIVNIPFIERQADAALMRSTFWVMEVDEDGPLGKPRHVLIYSQFIFLDFFPRRDGRPGLIRWPHVSINMMEKVALPPTEQNDADDDVIYVKKRKIRAPSRLRHKP